MNVDLFLARSKQSSLYEREGLKGVTLGQAQGEWLKNEMLKQY